MRHVVPVLAFLITSILASGSCLGQDALAPHKVKGLKGLRSLGVVIRSNTPREVASLKEWTDMVELGLHRNVPELTLSDATNTPDWLELSIITTDAGGFLELSVYRWVKVLASGEEIVSKVWWDSRTTFEGTAGLARYPSHELRRGLLPRKALGEGTGVRIFRARHAAAFAAR